MKKISHFLFFLVASLQLLHAQQVFIRQNLGFPVLDENGNAYPMPFLGGFNQPRLQLIDIDYDGDLDLFVQEVSGQLLLFINLGSRTEAKWRQDSVTQIGLEKPFGTWFRLADIDNDGRSDLFVEKPFSLVTYYRNISNINYPDFSLKADTLKDTNKLPVISEIGSVPEFADIDCDGDLDYFTSKADGTISYYNLQSVDANGVPQYKFMTDTFANILLNETYCAANASSDVLGKSEGTPELTRSEMSSARHGSAAMAFRDLNGDGKPDLLWGDTFTSSLLRINNTGSCQAPAFSIGTQSYANLALTPLLRTTGLNTATFGDLDGDGDEDMLVGVLGGYCPDKTGDLLDNIQHYENTGTKTAPNYELRTKRYLNGIDLGKKTTPTFADVDGDGDLDLVVGNESTITPLGGYGRLALFENTTTTTTPSFKLKDPNWLKVPQTYNLTPTFGDLDGDGDPDLLIGQFNGKIRFYQNNGGGNFVEAAREYFNIDVGSYSAPVLEDLDGDGDLDLLIGTDIGTLVLYRNQGTKTAPNFVFETDKYANIDAGDQAKPIFYDKDGDGKRDLFIGTEQNDIAIWLNGREGQVEKWTQYVGSTDLGSIILPGSEKFKVPFVAPAFFTSAMFIFGNESGGLMFFSYYRYLPPATETEVPEASLLLEAFPNPAASATTIRFALPSPDVVQLGVYDVLGREVAWLHEGATNSGEQRISFDTHLLPNGVYMLRLATTKQATTTRLVILK